MDKSLYDLYRSARDSAATWPLVPRLAVNVVIDVATAATVIAAVFVAGWVVSAFVGMFMAGYQFSLLKWLGI